MTFKEIHEVLSHYGPGEHFDQVHWSTGKAGLT